MSEYGKIRITARICFLWTSNQPIRVLDLTKSYNIIYIHLYCGIFEKNFPEKYFSLTKKYILNDLHIFLYSEEAENERMHLMTALELKQPGIIFRGMVLLMQGKFEFLCLSGTISFVSICCTVSVALLTLLVFIWRG